MYIKGKLTLLKVTFFRKLKGTFDNYLMYQDNNIWMFFREIRLVTYKNQLKTIL